LDARAIPAARPEHAGIYALSQGELPPGGIPATPALPNTGSLVQANADDTFTVFASPLNQPTSLEFIGEVAYIVTLGGACLDGGRRTSRSLRGRTSTLGGAVVSGSYCVATPFPR
jgi:hypothetical protein